MLIKKKLAAYSLVMLSIPLTGCINGMWATGLGYPLSGEMPPEPVAVAPAPPPPPSCQPGAPGQPISLEGCKTGDTIVLRGVNFEFNKSALTVNAKALLDGVADALLARPEVKVEIDGHTDNVGSDSYNLGLSARRVESVKEYLIGRGIDARRLGTKGYGESQPIASNDNEEGRELNRRVELKVIDTVATAYAPAPAVAAAKPAPAPAPAAAPAAGPAQVSISNFTFVPATLTVARGTTVTWVNKDGSTHTVKFPDGDRKLAGGQSYSMTFNQPGEFSYICGIHPSMSGKVVVL
jgi:OOP family OmpA-OmpF porin